MKVRLEVELLDYDTSVEELIKVILFGLRGFPCEKEIKVELANYIIYRKVDVYQDKNYIQKKGL
ncbi:MAG: hypothetical protein QHH15_00415 [Candidatus Thermoplasmatota archaeon]|nr:hypothetical protein [Candidatus Thermoplasmatota archaeon]MDH7506237.1 hypothetical protein [Candidatus Thermoplasmatota archaeon]